MKINYSFKPLLIRCILWDIDPNKELFRVKIDDKKGNYITLVECKVKKNAYSILNKLIEINSKDSTNWFITIEDSKIKTLHYKDNSWAF